jgi:hypothetical protein
MQKDAECLVNYIKSEFKVKLLGVHGQSIGGLIAANVAKTKHLDFLFADRTFSCLSDVASYGMKKIFKILFLLIT